MSSAPRALRITRIVGFTLFVLGIALLLPSYPTFSACHGKTASTHCSVGNELVLTGIMFIIIGIVATIVGFVARSFLLDDSDAAESKDS
jgi:hypothetical protein